jgi:hypothetical protein
MKMKLKIKGQNLKKIIDIVNSSTYPDIRLHFEEDKVWFRRVDVANVSLIDVELSKAAFIEYELIDEPFAACLDFGMLWSLKHLISPIIELQHFEKFKFSNVIGGGFNLSEIEDDKVKRDPDYPDITLTHQFEVKASILKSISYSAKRIDGKLKIRAKSGEVLVSSSDDKTDVYEMISNCAGEGEVSSVISADCVYNCTRHLTGMVEVHCGSDHPIKMINEPFDGCKIAFLIAPRVESE